MGAANLKIVQKPYYQKKTDIIETFIKPWVELERFVG